jgi:hypothetical protein
MYSVHVIFIIQFNIVVPSSFTLMMESGKEWTVMPLPPPYLHCTVSTNNKSGNTEKEHMDWTKARIQVTSGGSEERRADEWRKICVHSFLDLTSSLRSAHVPWCYIRTLYTFLYIRSKYWHQVSCNVTFLQLWTEISIYFCGYGPKS